MTARLEVTEGASEGALAAARTIIAASEQADGSSPVSDQALLAAKQGHRALLLFAEPREHHDEHTGSQGADPAMETAADRCDAPVAVGIIGQGELDLAVHPSARGRGIGSLALDALLQREPGDLLAWAHGENPPADALLSRAGFVPVRTLYRMALDPALLPEHGADPFGLPAPNGLRLRAFDPDSPSDAAAWVRVNAAAFAAHPEQGRITVDDFALMREEPWFDPADLLLLAPDDPEAEADLAGSTWIKTTNGDTGTETELYAIGVHPAQAGRGIGRFLLDATLARMAQLSPDRVTLYVDGENERAVQLYRHASFTIETSSRQWKRPAVSVASARMEP